MTVRIPRWLLISLAALVVVGGIGIAAFLLGRSSTDDGGGSGTVQSREETDEAPPPCNKQTAREAAVESLELQDDIRRVAGGGSGDELIGQVYRVVRIVCRDLTEDGVEEMAVQLACCTAGAADPLAIFTAEGGAWHLAYDRVGVSAQLSVEGNDLVEKTPAYGLGEPTCCPSGYRFGRITWDGEQFAYRSDDASDERVIKAGSQGISAFGPIDPNTATPLDVADAFGMPSSLFPDNELCAQTWLDLGLTINFANFGGNDPCGGDGRIGTIELEGPLAAEAGWRTDSGVRPDMSISALQEIYPDATSADGGGLVLIEGSTQIGTSGTYAVLAAEPKAGRAELLRFSVGAAGD